MIFWHELEPCCLNLVPWQGRRQWSGLYSLKIWWKLPESASQIKSKQCWTAAIARRCSPSWSWSKCNANVVLVMLSIMRWHLRVTFWSEDEYCFQAYCLDRVTGLSCPEILRKVHTFTVLININAYDVGLRHCRKMQPKLKLIKLKLRSVRGLSERERSEICSALHAFMQENRLSGPARKRHCTAQVIKEKPKRWLQKETVLRVTTNAWLSLAPFLQK